MREIKFAVIIPVYNGEKFLEDCIRSVKSQTYKNFQLIIVDNESTDSSIEILQNYDYITAKNIYKYTWDEAVEEAFKIFDNDIDYFTIVACDDIIEENYLQNLNMILSKSNVSLLQTPVKTFGASNQEIKYFYKTMQEYRDQLLQRCCVTTPSVVYSVGFKDDWWAKPDILAGASDYYRYCKYADKYQKMVVPFQKYIGYKYRIHEEQATWGMHKDYKGIDQIIQTEFREKWQEKEI